MLEIVFENEDLIAFDKPSGVSTLRDRTGLPNYFDEIRKSYPSVQLVHRLDKFTSGVLLVAKHNQSKRTLSRAFAAGKIQKSYVCVATGHLPTAGTLDINLPLKAGRKSRYRVAGLREEIRAVKTGWAISSEEGLPSFTRIRTLKQGPCRSMLICQPRTGRTHQLRVHLSWIGHAIVGDELYGAVNSAEQEWSRLLLHAHKLCLPNVPTAITSPLPDSFEDGLVYEPLGNQSSG